jgi:hypothetical protein
MARGARRWRIATLAATSVVLAAVIVSVILLDASSPPSALAQKFPVFSAASVQPSRAALGVMPANVKASASVAIQTAHGAGYVMASDKGRELCVAVPAPSARAVLEAVREGAYTGARDVGGCVTVARAERKGIVLVAPLEHRGVEVVIVLPAAASAPVIRREGHTTTLKVKDGTAVANVYSAAAMEYEVGGIRVSTAVESSPAHPRVVIPNDH